MIKKNKIVLATSNIGKVAEIQNFYRDLNLEVVPYSDLIDSFEIDETGSTFKENSIIKAKAVYEALVKNNIFEIVLSDDSGISVEALNWEPNIYSARFAGIGATSSQNLDKLISELNKLNIKESRAFYTACISIVSPKGEIFTTHGWMHGKVINQKIGNGGFGYDPCFVPNGEIDTLGVLPENIKEEYSHRTKALKLARILIHKLEADL